MGPGYRPGYPECEVKSMKTFRRAGMRMAMIAICCGTLCAIPVVAQDTAPATAAPQGGSETHGKRGDMTAMLTKRLNLTPDQQTQVKAINDDSRSQMMALRNDTSTPQADKRAKMMDIRKSSDDKIRAILTPDQQTKFDAMQAKMKDRMKERQQGGEAAPQ